MKNTSRMRLNLLILFLATLVIYFYLFVSVGFGMQNVSLKYSNVIRNAFQKSGYPEDVWVANWPGQGCYQIFLELCAGMIMPQSIIRQKRFMEVITSAVKNPCAYLVDPESDSTRQEKIHLEWKSNPNNLSNWKGFKCDKEGNGYEEWKVVLNIVNSEKKTIWRIEIL